MTKSLEAHDKLIKDIFSDEYQFRIPDYQRPYSWTTEQAGELLSDLLDAMRDFQTSNSTDNAFYFLGSIVLIKADRIANADVVDGQQRLTTLTILFSALRALLPSKARALTAFLYKEGLGIRDDEPNEYRLSAFQEDEAFFRDYIQEPRGIQRLVASTEKLVDSRLRFKENAALFLEELGKLTEEERASLLSFLAYKCSMVVISTPNFESAYRIFSVLNDRGLDLFPSDILKAKILGEIRKSGGEAKSKEYATKWTSLERKLGRNGFVDLLGHVRTIYAKKKQHAILSKEFTEFVAKGMPAGKLVDDVITPFADIYSFLKEANFQATEAAEDINEQLRHLNRVDWKDWVPPALSFFKKFRNQPRLIADFLKGLERLSYYLLVTKAGINSRIEHFVAVIEEIEKEGFDGVSESMKSLGLNDDEKRSFIAALDGDIYKKLPKARAALILRLEALKSDGSKKQEFSYVSIEHILPQTPSVESGWLDIFPDTVKREEWTQRLANLVPLHIRKNPAASNFNFDTKKNVYFAGNDGTASPFVLTQEIRSLPAWTPEVLEDRQQKLVDIFSRHWGLQLTEQ
ncbi:DUF262 domain-containing protein [Brucella tritici]|uniref:DUF262 domain-containing protein n=1 Tax=Brucella tritici TaxID=94626 RepID=A0A6L3YE13_9HYPH|nr:DUF262 domain-containing protein [Brucella tritici]KAB2680020.1 DUF262 domain-containing protein [Brucella tritici]